MGPTGTMGERARAITAGSLNTRLPVRYMLGAWLAVLSAVAYLDRTNISHCRVQMATNSRSTTPPRLGFSVAFLIGYAAFRSPPGCCQTPGPAGCWPGSGLVERLHGTHKLVRRACVARSDSGVVRFALGAGEAVMYPAASSLWRDGFRSRTRQGQWAGVRRVGVGSGLTPPLVTVESFLQHGWRTSF